MAAPSAPGRGSEDARLPGVMSASSRERRKRDRLSRLRTPRCAVSAAVGLVLVAAGAFPAIATAVLVPNETTSAPAEVSETSAVLEGRVEPISKAPVESCRFEYLTEAAFQANPAINRYAGAASAPCVPAPPYAAAANVSAPLEGLSPTTTYHFRLTAANATTTTSSTDRSFATVGLPRFEPIYYSNPSVHTATLYTQADLFGVEAACRVEYVDQADFAATGYATATTQPCAPSRLAAAFGLEPVSVSLVGLSIATEYHLRFVAFDGAGRTSVGPDQTFDTFGLRTFSFQDLDAEGGPFTQAGGHPYEWNTSFSFDTTRETFFTTPVANPKDILTELPPGLIGNPSAAPTCSRFEVAVALCPGDTQVGMLTVVQARETAVVGLYNVTPPKGVPALFGGVVGSLVRVYIEPRIRTGGDYGITAEALDSSQETGIDSITVKLWGVPADPAHDSERRCPAPGEPGNAVSPCSAAVSEPFKPFLSNPTSCSGSLQARLHVDSWQAIGEFAGASSELPPITGCNQIEFTPGLQARPTTNVADSPSGLHVDIHVPQNEDAAGRAEGNLRDATVTLPPGLVVNPSSANGLTACTAAQIGLTSTPGARPVTYTSGAPECPATSKLGTVEVDTPLLDHPLPGSVYLAQPFENPFDSLLAIYITVDDPQSGVVVKLAGQVRPDPQTGRLTSIVEESPQLPFEDFKLDFFKGAGAPLRTPALCGAYETGSSLTPWSAPESGPPATPSDHYEISSAANGGGCAHTAAQEPNSPSFEAGTQAPSAGAFSPFVLHLARADGSQELSSIDTTLPAGLIGRLAGVSECSDAQLAAAARHSGAAEQQSPSCPASSELGTVQVGAGAGPQPYYATGHAYLAGPYKGAPLSLAIITPAVAGPFDLGTVVVRTALQVNAETTQITAVSDPIPHILQGIPLDVRSVSLDLKRSDFTLNPTNCEKKTITGSVGTVQGQSAAVSNPFQVGGCKSLGFAPKLQLSLKGSTKHAGHPALKAVLTYPKGGVYANIARAQVNLPHSEFIDQSNLNKTCTKPVLLAGKCPATSIYGKAKAWTPLLAKPLEGPVYLVGGYGYKLPALVAELNGQIRVLLVGKVDSGPNHGIRNTFEAVPDAPVEKFELQLKGGPKYSLLENSEDLCEKPQKAIADFTAQNGRVLHTTPVIANGCKGNGKGRKGKKGKHHKRKKGDGAGGHGGSSKSSADSLALTGLLGGW
jgi:hypothetical protein